MPVIYNSKKIIPAPFASITKDYQTREDGTLIGSVYQIVLKGKLVAFAGSPNSQGVLWDQSGYPPNENVAHDSHLTSLLNKQDALKRLFAEHGKTLEIQPIDGMPPTKCNPRIRRIEFAEGPWFQTVDFSITMEADVLYLNGVAVENTEFTEYISKANEEWNIEAIDETKQQYRVTHNVSATGKLVYDETGTVTLQPWERAKAYVLATLGLGLQPERMNETVLANWTGEMQAFNYLRSQQLNETGGTFSVTETWLCFAAGGGPAAFDDRNITQKTSAVEAGRQTVSVEGTVTGYEVRDNTTGVLVSTRWANALAKFLQIEGSIHAAAQTVSGVTLNPLAISSTIGRNQIAGTISYHFDYDNRPESNIPDAISEIIQVTTNKQGDVFAEVPVLGRPLGPILQDIGTKTKRQKTISIEVQMKPATMTYTPTEPNTDAKVLARRPSGSQVFMGQDDHVWSENTGKYSRTTVFVWEA